MWAAYGDGTDHKRVPAAGNNPTDDVRLGYCAPPSAKLADACKLGSLARYILPQCASSVCVATCCKLPECAGAPCDVRQRMDAAIAAAAAATAAMTGAPSPAPTPSMADASYRPHYGPQKPFRGAGAAYEQHIKSDAKLRKLVEQARARDAEMSHEDALRRGCGPWPGAVPCEQAGTYKPRRTPASALVPSLRPTLRGSGPPYAAVGPGIRLFVHTLPSTLPWGHVWPHPRQLARRLDRCLQLPTQ